MLLKVQNLSISVHGQPILNNVSIAIPAGSLAALVGPNGSGKSTLAYALAGHSLYTITNGSIIFNEQDITHLTPDARARIGIFLIMQQPPEIPGVNVLTFLYESYRALKEQIALEQLKEQAIIAFKGVGLPESFLSRSLHEGFSGGEKKRFEAAQLLLFKPLFAILDELDAGLDSKAFDAVIEVLKLLRQENPFFSALIITHNPRLLTAICPDRTLAMEHGNVF